MVDEDIQHIQKSVERDLFEEQNKILDRFYSLITLTITVSGFSFTFLTLMLGKGTSNFQEALHSSHISLSFICIILAFLISIVNVLAIFHYRRLVNKGGTIVYREDDELVTNNRKLYLAIARQKNYYVIAITLVGLGLVSLFNHFSQHHILTTIIGIGFIVVMLLLIHNSRRYLS